MSWRPILSGALAERALASAREVADAVCALEPADPSEAMDFALFWAYVAGVFDDEPRYDERLDAAIEAVGAVLEGGEPLGGQLFGGYAGAAWVLHHISGDDEELGPEEEGDVVSMLDGALLDALDVETWGGLYDLIGGLVGIGVHFVDRLPRASARTGLERVVALLDGISETHDAWITWHTNPEHLPAWQRERNPSGYYNLGLAHGVPGVVALLADVVAADVVGPRARELLVGASRFVLDAASGDDNGLYPSFVETLGDTGARARTAWCYGDPGVAIALARAGATLGDAAMTARAVDIARSCAARPAEACVIQDAGLCHGSAGLGHLLNRLHQHTGDDACRASAVAWFERTLETRRDHGHGGYPAFRGTFGDSEWEALPGILEGAGGVALALLAAATDIEPGWDRPLLVDLPPR